MPSLKEVRNRISSVKSTQQITKAMKMVAAAKLGKATEAIKRMRPYSDMLEGILNNLSANTSKEDLESEFMTDREIQNVLIVTITSDRGLCGAFNMNVMKEAMILIEEKYSTHFKAGKVSFLTVGNKSRDYVKRRNYAYNADFTGTFQGLSLEKVKTVAEYILDKFRNKEVDCVELVYNEFKNAATQSIKQVKFLPIEDKKPVDKKIDTKKSQNIDYILEPSKEEIISELIPKILKVQFYRAILESNAAEHGARMTAMDKATDNAGELLKDLLLTYNRTRQAAITKEILEIVGGAEALKG